MNSAKKGYVIGGKLNLRKEPSVFSKSLVLIPNGVQIHIWEENAKWFKAVYQQYFGYVMKAYVRIETPYEMLASNWMYAKVLADPLNVRREPHLSAMRWNSTWPIRRIALVKETDIAGWYETTYRGEKAYVSSEYMLPLATVVSEQIPVRMMYMAASEIGRDNSRDFGGYTGQWCHRFADWLVMHAGTPKNLIPNTSNCGKGIVWFVNDAESGGFYFKNAEHKTRMISNYSTIRHLPKELTEEEEAYIPAPGDYIYFRWRNAAKDVNVSHVGIVSSVSEDKLTTVEGNAGGAVANRSYALNDDRIVGYGKPRYDAVG